MNEFQWNKVLPKKDYLYFLDARIYAHVNSLVHSFPKSNAVYLSAKENGDLNAIFSKIKDKKIPKGFVVDYVKGYDNATFAIFNLARVDACTGQLGDYIYCMNHLGSGIVLHKIPFKMYRQNKKIIQWLDWYRKNGTSDANSRFDDLYSLAFGVMPKVRIHPLKKKAELWRGL